MKNFIKRSLRSGLRAAGIDVRIASRVAGADPVRDMLRLHTYAPFRTILDVGANVGQSALRFQKAFPLASIHSLEPVLASYNCGRDATAGLKTVNFHHLAVGNTSKHISFYSSGTSQLNSVRPTDKSPSDEMVDLNEVEMIQLDDFCAEHKLEHIDLLKTDTEGFDLGVLEGSQRLLEARRVSFILCEVGFSPKDISHSFFPLIAGFVERFGYRLLCFYDLSDTHHFQKWGFTYGDALFAVPEAHADS